MANDLNLCQFIGRLGHDPEVRATAKGETVTNLSIAVNESWSDKTSGEKKELTTWVNVVAFGRLAEVMRDYLSKGSMIYVSGKLTVRKWQDKNGDTKYATEIVAREMQMLGWRSDGAQARNSDSRPQPQPAMAPATGFDDFEDPDIPFN